MPSPYRISGRARDARRNSLPDFLLAAIQARESLQREVLILGGQEITRWTGEFWTSRQRQACSLHEISYRACFKPQLPRFFIELLTQSGDRVYDPFMGRGTTPIEAALLGRSPVGNDINPLSAVLTRPRLNPPHEEEVARRLEKIRFQRRSAAGINLSMFFHPDTEAEIVSLRHYLLGRAEERREDHVDQWIRMVATNRLTGHSSGFFSVYTLPPNQAMSPASQIKVNRLRKQKPEYREIRSLITKKTRSLLQDITDNQRSMLRSIDPRPKLLHCPAWQTAAIESRTVRLTVTSPPFLDVVDYAQDNWMRGWFNGFDQNAIGRKITVVKTLEEWKGVMARVFTELHRVTQRGGMVAFEVGEIRKRNLRLDEIVVPLGVTAGFECAGILINRQRFTKTSHIWGIRNNLGGTNTNRIVIFHKTP